MDSGIELTEISLEKKEDKTNLNCDEAGLETVINAYNHALLRYCHSILCDYHEAKDAVQLTFIKLYNSQKSFEQDKDLSNFLYKIAYNTCIDIIRKRKSQVHLCETSKNSSISTTSVNNDYIPENIKTALLSLSGHDRAVVYSHAVEGIQFAELAKIYGKTAATLRKRYERARKKLSKLLSDDYPEYVKNPHEIEEEIEHEQE